MIQTNNYEFNIVEGNDIVNPLVQLNPNFTKLDTLLKAIADTGIGSALQVKSGSNHAITKDDDCTVFKFIATADYRTGDTFTLNGDTVTLRCMDGTVPKDRAFVINQSVMCAINGTLLTLIGGAGSVDASDVNYSNATSGLSATNAQSAIDELSESENIKYDNTTSGLTATTVQGAIDELASDDGSISVTSDGMKTYAQILAELYGLITPSKITEDTIFKEGNTIYRGLVIDKSSNAYRFLATTFNNSILRSYSVLLSASSRERLTCTATFSNNTFSFTDNTSDIVPNGITYTIKY